MSTKPERQVIRITREEVAPRMSGSFYQGWKHLYRIEGITKPTHRLALARKYAKAKFPGARIVLAWKESE